MILRLTGTVEIQGSFKLLCVCLCAEGALPCNCVHGS